MYRLWFSASVSRTTRSSAGWPRGGLAHTGWTRHPIWRSQRRGRECLLVAIGQVDNGRARLPPSRDLHEKHGSAGASPSRDDLVDEFARRFPSIRQRFADALGHCATRDDKVAILGAGHLACAFI